VLQSRPAKLDMNDRTIQARFVTLHK
jgi:hypothetical protein